MVGISIKTRGPKLTSLELVSDRDLRGAGSILRDRIVDRARQGVHASGSAYPAYSPQYAKRKQQETGMTGVNLTLSGNMLRDLKVTMSRKNRVRIGY